LLGFGIRTISREVRTRLLALRPRLTTGVLLSAFLLCAALAPAYQDVQAGGSV